MGYRISWLAVQGLAKDRTLAILNLSDTGEPDEANEAPLSVADLPDGWTVLWSNDETYASDDRAAHMSRAGASVIAAHVNETCMHSTVSFFAGGERLWRIHHEGDQRIDFLETDGDLPLQAFDIEAHARASQAAEDVDRAEVDWLFEIPLEVARTVCGYKHDFWQYDWGEPSFTVVAPQVSLASDRRPETGILSRLFGRGR